jgi:hypothetical protein
MGIKVSIDTRGWENKKSRILDGLPKAVVKIVKTLAYMGESKMSSECPEDSTTLRSSIKTSFSDGGKKAVVEPHKKYAKFVVVRTKASPGRYVPAIGKRLVNPPLGMHPGTPKDDFVGRAREYVKGEADGVISRVVSAFVKEVQ